MAMNLQSELEPLLAKLSATVKVRYFAAILPHVGGNDADLVNKRMVEAFDKAVEPALLHITDRFRSYYTLDTHPSGGGELDGVADLFATRSDHWETPTGDSVYCNIARASGRVDDVAKLVQSEHWYGPAAQAFHKNFLCPFKNTAAVHGQGARELAIAAKTLAEAVQRAKEYVVYICKEAIGGYPNLTPGEKDGADGVKKSGGILAILADVVAFFNGLLDPATKVKDLLLAGAAVFGGLVAEADNPEHDESVNCQEVRFDVGVPELAFDGVFQALNALDRNIAALDQRLSRGLDNDLRPAGPFGRPEASIISTIGTGASTFPGYGTLGEHGGPGYHVDREVELTPSAYRRMTTVADPESKDKPGDPLVIDIAKLYEAGNVSLPNAAQSYENGVRVCAGAHITGVHQFPRSTSRFNEAVGMYGRLLSAMRDHLTISGESMITAAKNYEYVDDHEASLIRQYESQIPSPSQSPTWTPPDRLSP